MLYSILQYKMLVVGVKSNRGRLRTDGFMVGSFSDRPRIVNDVSSVFRKFL